MSLADFSINKVKVDFRGGSLELRGLALEDISVLVRHYLPELNALFDMYDTPETRDTAISQSGAFAIKIIKEAPELVAQLIVLAADEPQEHIDIARRLPLPIQVECVRAVIDLTFEEAGGAKKFLDSLMGMVTNLRPKAKAEALDSNT